MPGGRSAIGEIIGWVRRYLQSHPLMSLSAVGGRLMLGVRAVQYLFFDLFAGRLQVGSSSSRPHHRRTTFVPTLLVTIPIGVTLSIQFACWPGNRRELAVRRGNWPGGGPPGGPAGRVAAAGGSGGLGDVCGPGSTDDAIRNRGAGGDGDFAAAAHGGSAACRADHHRGLADRGHQLRRVHRRLRVQRVHAGRDTGSFVATFASFATVGDLTLALVKAVVFAAIVATIAATKAWTPAAVRREWRTR